MRGPKPRDLPLVDAPEGRNLSKIYYGQALFKKKSVYYAIQPRGAVICGYYRTPVDRFRFHLFVMRKKRETTCTGTKIVRIFTTRDYRSFLSLRFDSSNVFSTSSFLRTVPCSLLWPFRFNSCSKVSSTLSSILLRISLLMG
jgi:hypothetical protein